MQAESERDVYVVCKWYENDEGKRKISLSLGHLRAHTVLCGEMIAVRTGRQKILLFSMLSFVCFSSSTSESEIFTSSCCFFCVKRFFPFSNVNANLNRQLWWFLFRYIFHFYIWYPPAYVRSCAYENKKAIANDCRHSSEWKRSVMSFTYSFAVLVFCCCCCCFCMRSGKHQIIRFIERDSQLKKKRH